jgi:hypothetical protein
MARLVRVASGIAIAAVRSPDAKSPTAAEMLAAWDGCIRRTARMESASATADPQVPGATGESPEPNPVEKKVENGRSRNARATGEAADDVEDRVDADEGVGEDGDVLIDVGSRVYNRATRAELSLPPPEAERMRTCPA